MALRTDIYRAQRMSFRPPRMWDCTKGQSDRGNLKNVLAVACCPLIILSAMFCLLSFYWYDFVVLVRYILYNISRWVSSQFLTAD